MWSHSMWAKLPVHFWVSIWEQELNGMLGDSVSAWEVASLSIIVSLLRLLVRTSMVQLLFITSALGDLLPHRNLCLSP